MFGRTVAWGLDIGSATIKAVKLRKVGKSVEVLDFDVVEIEYSEDESTRPARVKAALSELMRRKHFGRTGVFFSVPGNQVFFRPFNLPSVQPGKVAEIVKYEARQQVPFSLEEVVWDYQAVPSGPGGEMTVSLVAIRKEIVDRLLEVLLEANLNVVGLAPSPIAVLNYVNYDVDPGETCLVLDVGAKVTDFVILSGGNFWFRPLPVAGGDLTRVLETKFRIPYPEAENLKLKMGESKQADKMFQVIEPTLRSLAGEIQRTAGYYKSLSRDVRIVRVFGIGHTFQLPGLADFLSKNIEMGVEVLASPQRITVSGGVDTTWFAEEFQGMGAALGLALQALGLVRVRMSLLPEAIRKQNRARVRRYFFSAAAAAIIALAACRALAAREEITGVEHMVGRMQETLQKVAAQQESYNRARKPITAREDQLRRWSQIGVEHGLSSEVLGKTLGVVEKHNKAINPASDSSDGQLYLTSFYVGWSSPAALLGASRGMGPEMLGETVPASRSHLFVAARFECRGRSVDPAVQFERELRDVPGFVSARPNPKSSWRAGDPEYANITHLGYRDEKATKGVLFWAVWRYDLAGGGKAAP